MQKWHEALVWYALAAIEFIVIQCAASIFRPLPGIGFLQHDGGAGLAPDGDGRDAVDDIHIKVQRQLAGGGVDDQVGAFGCVAVAHDFDPVPSGRRVGQDGVEWPGVGFIGRAGELAVAGTHGHEVG